MERGLVSVGIIIIIRSTLIITDPVEHLVYAADPQSDMLEMTEETVNIEESVVVVGKNQFTDEGLNLGIVRLSLG